MRTLGIVGGIAPPSTIDYYRQLVALYRDRTQRYPRIVIDSVDASAFLPLVTSGPRDGLIAFLVAELERLAAAGADVALFASNTPHVVFDEVQARSPLPLVSIVEAAADEAVARRYTRVGLLGAGITMESDIYPSVFLRRRIDVIVPEASDRRLVNDRYFAELVEGTFLDSTRAEISSIVDRMREREEIDAVVLGGTELPLLFRGSGLPRLPALDTTAIHVEAAIDALLA